jgi:hypothetical protein
MSILIEQRLRLVPGDPVDDTHVLARIDLGLVPDEAKVEWISKHRIKSRAARRSPWIDLFATCITVASAFVTVRVPRELLMRTFCRDSLRTIVARFFEPLGRPLGLPDRPFWNRPSLGGLP